jgi:hypothetical protein
MTADPTQHPARLAILQQLRQAALEAYGEARSADDTVQSTLELAATALWRVLAEPLDLHDVEPFATDDGPSDH